MRSGKKLIVFDIGNVLLRFSQERAGKNFDRIEPGAGKVLVRAMWKTRLGIDLEAGRLSGREFLRKATRGTGVRVGFAPFRRAFQDIFTPIRPNLRLLAGMSKHYPTALLSNTSELHWRYLFKAYPGLRAARWKFASHLLKLMKPDPKIFKIVSQKTGFPFEDIVYVDDRVEFVRAAERLGIHGICFNGRTPLKQMFDHAGIPSAPIGMIKK